MRLRRSSETRRYVASPRLGRIDPNPHQIEAVMFALRRIPEGGCILADEVGLGKTIEAGLVIAQVMRGGVPAYPGRRSQAAPGAVAGRTVPAVRHLRS